MMAAVENGILARLKAASDAGWLGYRYKTLATYPVDWDAYMSELKGGMPAPAAWATFAGWRAVDGENLAGFHVAATFGLVVMAQNLRDEQATRHGGPDQANEPGSYRMAMDAAALLHGQDFGLPIESLSIGRLQFVQRMPAWGERKISMLAIELLTGFRQNVIEGQPDAQLAAFETFHANWDIPPFGNVDGDAEEEGVQIPADETADATDHVTLETEQP